MRFERVIELTEVMGPRLFGLYKVRFYDKIGHGSVHIRRELLSQLGLNVGFYGEHFPLKKRMLNLTVSEAKPEAGIDHTANPLLSVQRVASTDSQSLSATSERTPILYRSFMLGLGHGIVGRSDGPHQPVGSLDLAVSKKQFERCKLLRSEQFSIRLS